MRALLLVLLLISGCLTIETTPVGEDHGLTPGTEVDYYAFWGQPELADEAHYTIRLDAATFLDRYAQEIDGWRATVTSPEGYPFPLKTFVQEHALDPERIAVWHLDGCGQPLTWQEEETTYWYGSTLADAPPLVAALQEPPTHDAIVTMADAAWEVDNRVTPPELMIPATGIDVRHERQEVRPGSGSPPACTPYAPAPAPVHNMSSDMSGFAPGLEPPFQEALAASRGSMSADEAEDYFADHPDAVPMRMWYDPDGSRTHPALESTPGMWHILWNDGSTEALVTSCGRDPELTGGAVACDDRVDEWDTEPMPGASAPMANPQTMVERSQRVAGECDLIWYWSGLEPQWWMAACTTPVADRLSSGFAIEVLFDASNGDLLFVR